jgi:hypothetical protein
MTDPTRWSEAGDSATHAEQLLVRSGQELVMPGDEKHAVWSRIVDALPAGAALSATSKAAAVGSGSLIALKGAKTLCVLAAASGITAGGYHWLRNSHRGPAGESLQLVATASTPPTITAVPELVPAPVPMEASNSAPVAIPPATLSRVSLLREESLAVVAARQALRSNDAGKALHLLDQAQQRFKKGALTEEREALAIEALAKAGQPVRASTRAQAFLTNYPRSPHVADVQHFVAK